MRVDRPLILLLATLAGGCADPEPFVDVGGKVTPTYNKPIDPILQQGTLNICYSDATPWSEVEALAAERCATYGLTPRLLFRMRWQCRATSPHSVSFQCYDPAMMTAKGTPVNPFDPSAVQQWEKRTGKKAATHNTLTTSLSTAPTATAPAAVTTPDTEPAPAAETMPATTPTAAPATVPPPLTPADIADKPALAPQPVVTAPPPTPATSGGAYPMDGFTLPQGSWGDAFQE